MNYKSKYLKYKLKYLTAKKQGGMFPLTEDSETRREEEEKERNKQAIETREQGKENPLITRKTPLSYKYPIEPYEIQTDKGKPTLGDSPSKEINTQTDVMPDFDLGKSEIPLKINKKI